MWKREDHIALIDDRDGVSWFCGNADKENRKIEHAIGWPPAKKSNI